MVLAFQHQFGCRWASHTCPKTSAHLPRYNCVEPTNRGDGVVDIQHGINGRCDGE